MAKPERKRKPKRPAGLSLSDQLRVAESLTRHMEHLTRTRATFAEAAFLLGKDCGLEVSPAEVQRVSRALGYHWPKGKTPGQNPQHHRCTLGPKGLEDLLEAVALLFCEAATPLPAGLSSLIQCCHTDHPGGPLAKFVYTPLPLGAPPAPPIADSPPAPAPEEGW